MNLIKISLIATGLVALSAAAAVDRPQGRVGSTSRAIRLEERKVIGAPASLRHETPLRVAGQHSVLTENFSLCSAGTEAAPDPDRTIGEIPSSLTSRPGWVGAAFRQAGGCAFLDTHTITYQGEEMDVHYLDTPILGIPSGESLAEVRFRVRSASTQGDKFYILNADGGNGSTLSGIEINISGSWEEKTAYIQGCNVRSFLEFQSDAHPFYIDDIEVSVFDSLEAPSVLPATDISLDGFTANWSPVSLASGYIVAPKSIHISNGFDPRFLINTDFSSITSGTIENPTLPEYSVYSLDDYIDQKGWLVRLPYFAGGALGLSNEMMGSYGNSLLQSPTLNLSGNDGQVNVKMRYLAKDVDMFQVSLYSVFPDGRVSLRSTKMIYTGEVFDKWFDEEFTISGGTVSSMLVILLPETTHGTIFLDSLQMWQVLDEGTRYTEPMTQVISETTSARVATPGSSEEDSFSYSVTAWRTLPDGSRIYSDPSGEIIVGNSSAEEPTELAAPAPSTGSIEGGRFTATWPAVEGANSYRVDLYRRHESNGFESFDVINENFDGIRVGTTDLDRPRAMSEDGYDRLDAYTKQPGWEVFQGFYVDGAVGILGYWNMLGVGCYMRSPEFDLSANGGKMTMNVSVGSDYYEQGATIYLAHENKETGALVYDEMFPMDEMSKGFHKFTTQFTKGRQDSFFIFYPYGYGLSYFDDIRVSQQLPAGISTLKVSSRHCNGTEVTMTVPDFVQGDEYFYTVTALWIDSNDIQKVESEASQEMPLPGLVKTTYYTGRVVDAEGEGVANATVRLVNNSNPTDIASAKTNRWGLFRVENIADFSATYTPLASAPGFLTGMASGVTFTGGQPAEDNEIHLRPAANETTVEVGLPTRFTSTGAFYLQFNNSESETLYPAEAIGLPAGSLITAIAYDGYCDKEKEVTYNMEILLQNSEEAEIGIEPTPRSEMTLFASGSRQIAPAGSQELPAELVRFENPEGFRYEGGALRIFASSRSNKGNNVYFLADATQPGRSIYRYWGSSESNVWKTNANGMPALRIEYTPDFSGITDFIEPVAAPVKASGAEGCIIFHASAPCSVNVYSASGIHVATLDLQQGETTVAGFLPGLYIAGREKVIVR